MDKVRLAREEDLSKIEEIYAYARGFMARTGNPNQWGTKNPPTSQLREDIKQEKLYVVTEGDRIRGVFFFSLGEDPTYGRIEEGQWASGAPYGTIHRVASDGSGGVFGTILEFCWGRIQHLRIDTHRDNHVMQHVLRKHGFQPRGIIYIADGSPRIAYERV